MDNPSLSVPGRSSDTDPPPTSIRLTTVLPTVGQTYLTGFMRHTGPIYGQTTLLLNRQSYTFGERNIDRALLVRHFMGQTIFYCSLLFGVNVVRCVNPAQHHRLYAP